MIAITVTVDIGIKDGLGIIPFSCYAIIERLSPYKGSQSIKTSFMGPQVLSCIETSIIECLYCGGSTTWGSNVAHLTCVTL